MALPLPVATRQQTALARWRTSRWPARAATRWATRVLLAAPYLGLCIYLAAEHYQPTANGKVIAAAHSVVWGSTALQFLGHVAPPLPVLLARLPSPYLALGIIAALASGFAGQMHLERFHARGNPRWLAWWMVLALRTTPVVAFVVSSSLSGFLGLFLMAAGLSGLLDFVYNRSTESGFFAGLAFGLATTCDLACAPFALGAGIAAIALSNPDRVREPGRHRALLCVIVLPTVAFLASWIFLEWRFTGRPLSFFQFAEPGLRLSRIASLEHFEAALRGVGRAIVVSPTLVGATVLLARRRLSSVVAVTVPILLLVGLRVVGFSYPLATLTLFLQMLALIAIPERLNRIESAVLAVTALAQLALTWRFFFITPQFASYLRYFH